MCNFPPKYSLNCYILKLHNYGWSSIVVSAKYFVSYRNLVCLSLWDFACLTFDVLRYESFETKNTQIWGHMGHAWSWYNLKICIWPVILRQRCKNVQNLETQTFPINNILKQLQQGNQIKKLNAIITDKLTFSKQSLNLLVLFWTFASDEEETIMHHVTLCYHLKEEEVIITLHTCLYLPICRISLLFKRIFSLTWPRTEFKDVKWKP